MSVINVALSAIICAFARKSAVKPVNSLILSGDGLPSSGDLLIDICRKLQAFSRVVGEVAKDAKSRQS